MAKKRDDEELHDDEVAEEAVEAAEEADVADADEVQDADLAEEDAAVAEEAEDAAPYDEEPYEEEPPRKKPKVTVLTLTLCFLNVLAALGFVFLLMLDFEKRQGYTFAAAHNEMVLIGVGTKEDRQGDTAAQAAMPRQKLSDELLKKAFRERGGTTSVTEPFASVEDGFRFQLYAGELGPALLREMMSDLGDPVGNIEEEMARLKRKLPDDIKAVADQLKTNLAKATPADKRKKLGMLLYPLCVNPMQVEKLEAKIKGAQGAALDTLLEEAVERRILADILLPVELFRASDPNQSTAKANDVKLDKKPLYPNDVATYSAVLENAADAKIKDLRDLLNWRLDAAASEKHDGKVHFGTEWDGQKRWTIEKRANSAFLLVSIAYARKHLNPNAKIEDELLYAKGLERAQRLSGLYDFTAACQAYNEVVRKLHERVLEALALDREGFDVQVDVNNVKTSKRSESFIDKHAALQVQIRAVQLQIRQAKERIAALQQENDRGTKLVKDREALRDEVAKRTLEERAKTAALVKELRQLQDQMFRATRDLANAAENNAVLEERLRKLSGAKGAEQ